MSMPLIEKVDQTGHYNPSTWTLRSTKGKIIYVRYARGELTCRYDNEYNGQQFYIKKFTGTQQPPVGSLNTEDMFRITKFKLDHKELVPSVTRSN